MYQFIQRIYCFFNEDLYYSFDTIKNETYPNLYKLYFDYKSNIKSSINKKIIDSIYKCKINENYFIEKSNLSFRADNQMKNLLNKSINSTAIKTLKLSLEILDNYNSYELYQILNNSTEIEFVNETYKNENFDLSVKFLFYCILFSELISKIELKGFYLKNDIFLLAFFSGGETADRIKILHLKNNYISADTLNCLLVLINRHCNLKEFSFNPISLMQNYETINLFISNNKTIRILEISIDSNLINSKFLYLPIKNNNFMKCLKENNTLIEIYFNLDFNCIDLESLILNTSITKLKLKNYSMYLKESSVKYFYSKNDCENHILEYLDYEISFSNKILSNKKLLQSLISFRSLVELNIKLDHFKENIKIICNYGLISNIRKIRLVYNNTFFFNFKNLLIDKYFKFVENANIIKGVEFYFDFYAPLMKKEFIKKYIRNVHKGKFYNRKVFTLNKTNFFTVSDS